MRSSYVYGDELLPPHLMRQRQAEHLHSCWLHAQFADHNELLHKQHDALTALEHRGLAVPERVEAGSKAEVEAEATRRMTSAT